MDQNSQIKQNFIENIPSHRPSDYFYFKDFQVAIEKTKEHSNFEIYKAMIDATLSSLFYSFNTIIVKETGLISKKFTPFNFLLWRGITSSLVLYLYLKKNNPERNYFDLSHITHRNWFYIRTLGFYFGFIFFAWCIMIIRVSLGQVLMSIGPLFSLIISVIVLKEIFYMRYLIGIIVCFLGTAIITCSEKGNSEGEEKSNYNFFSLLIGVIFAFINCLANGLVNVGQKVLTDDKMTNNEQIFYLSLGLIICSFVICTFTLNFGFDWYIIIFGTINGANFYLANHFFQEALKVLNVGGCVPFTYFCTLFVFIESVFVLGEPLYFTDILGSLIIVSFHIYNAWYPIKG